MDAPYVIIHSGVLPHACNQCEYATTTKSSLKSHMHKHEYKEKTFYCDHCKYSFTNGNSLSSHLRSHRKERLFDCKQCEAKFKRSSEETLTGLACRRKVSFLQSMWKRVWQQQHSTGAHSRAQWGKTIYV